MTGLFIPNELTDRECDWTFPPRSCSPPPGTSRVRRRDQKKRRRIEHIWVGPGLDPLGAVVRSESCFQGVSSSESERGGVPSPVVELLLG